MKHQLIMPSSIDHLRNAIIDKLMAISNKDFLVALNKLVESAVEGDLDKEELPKHVIEGIKRGQADFEAGRYITFDAFKKKLSAK
ncbi:putative transcriptional regulator [Pedobacter africanus]|uniref:Transcriptional regulator n=1 Tax=Pedobacter africanus TaxID=151894 RepID=A0ACC6KZ31_9SPHI|nr:hypothetical protein [Pedobacter africanus]MDR6784614.1 putative transcriptional regulator [Pedobacter africanus]